MPLEAVLISAVTKALQGAVNAVGFQGAQVGDVRIGYVAGEDIHIHLHLQAFAVAPKKKRWLVNVYKRCANS